MSNENGRVAEDVHEAWSQIGNLSNPIWENQITLHYNRATRTSSSSLVTELRIAGVRELFGWLGGLVADSFAA